MQWFSPTIPLQNIVLPYKGYRFSLRCTKLEIHGKLFGEICELFLLIEYKITLHYYNWNFSLSFNSSLSILENEAFAKIPIRLFHFANAEANAFFLHNVICTPVLWKLKVHLSTMQGDHFVPIAKKNWFLASLSCWNKQRLLFMFSAQKLLWKIHWCRHSLPLRSLQSLRLSWMWFRDRLQERFL